MVWWRRKEGIQLASYAEVANQVGADDKAVRGGVACGAVTVGALVIGGARWVGAEGGVNGGGVGWVDHGHGQLQVLLVAVGHREYML